MKYEICIMPPSMFVFYAIAIIPQKQKHNLNIYIFQPTNYPNLYDDIEINIDDGKGHYTPKITLHKHPHNSELPTIEILSKTSLFHPDMPLKTAKKILQNKDNIQTIHDILIQTLGV